MNLAELREKTADRRFPLCWPSDQTRTPNSQRVYGQFKGTLDQARREVLYEIDQLIYGKSARFNTARAQIVISSNYRLRADGEIHASAKEPEDPGVAIYFTRNKKPLCFACDKYDRVWKNIRAIQRTIEAMRGIERWGSTQLLERAFTGFAALPESTAAGWPTVLGIESSTATEETVKKAFRGLVQKYHEAGETPDSDKLREVQDAYRDAMAQLNGHLRPSDHR